MTIHATDVLTPVGRLNAAALWPGVDPNTVIEYVDEYLGQGYERAAAAPLANQDEAARQWAYYRAWDEKYQALSAMPSHVQTSDEGSSTYVQKQIDAWKELADEALEWFKTLVPVDQPLFPATRMSRAMAADFVW